MAWDWGKIFEAVGDAAVAYARVKSASDYLERWTQHEVEDWEEVITGDVLRMSQAEIDSVSSFLRGQLKLNAFDDQRFNAFAFIFEIFAGAKTVRDLYRRQYLR